MGIRSRYVSAALSAVLFALSSGSAAAASQFDSGIIVGTVADFSTNVNLQGNALDFNRGASRMFDNNNLHITTDDDLFLDASSTTLVKNHLKVGGSLTVSSGPLNLPAGSIDSADILNGTIVSADLAGGSYAGITSVGTLASLTVIAPISGSVTGSSGSTTGNAATSTALAANGANCSAGLAPLGVDASGAVEGCTAYLGSSLLDGRIFVGNGSNVAAGVPVSGDATISNTGAVTLVRAYGMFFGLTTGTGMAGTDYAATITAGAAVPFPQTGATIGGIVPVTTSTFKIPAIGIYEVSFSVHTTEPGQLHLTVDDGSGFAVARQCTGGNMNPTAGGHPIIGHCLITTTAVDTVVKVINPVGNTPALTITPADGASTNTNAQTLIIKKL